MNLFPSLRLVAGILLLAVLSPRARANDDFCLTQPSYYVGSYYFCADSDASGTVSVAQPDAIGSMPVLAQSGGSTFGGGSLEYAFAGPGVLRGYANALVVAPPPMYPPYDGSHGIADARIFDSGLIDPGSSGLALGTQVSATITLTVEGGFGGDGEARTTATLYDNLHPVRQDVTNLADILQPSSTIQFVVTNLFIGDSLALDYMLTAEAGATNQPPGTLTQSLADASNTALIRIDFLTPGVTFDAASGYDYASNAAVTPPGNPGQPSSVPEPSILLLGATGLAVARLKRRRAVSAATTPQGAVAWSSSAC